MRFSGPTGPVGAPVPSPPSRTPPCAVRSKVSSPSVSFLQVTPKVTPSSGASAPSGARWSEQMDRGHGGYLLVIAPALFATLGWWLDGILGWAPILMIVGGVYGLGGALYKVINSYRTEMVAAGVARSSARSGASVDMVVAKPEVSA